MFPEGKQYNKHLNYRIMQFTKRELTSLKALVYKEIMNQERGNNKEEAFLFREIYYKLKGLTGSDPYAKVN
jgi:hypothetical protein